MSLGIPEIRVGQPLRYQSLSVFPLFTHAPREVEYRLSDEALGDETLLVEEVDQSGSVPELLVENKGDTRVLFLEGEELIGAKQNRILNTSVLIGAGSKLKIPVSCVERGRWGYKSRYFGSSGSHSPSKLRRALKRSVSQSVKQQRGHNSDQGEIWKEVASLHSSHNVTSATAAMSDAFESYQDQIDSYREKLPYVDHATGFAVAIENRVVSIDLFDKPATCQKVWDRMLSGVVFDALESGSSDKVATAEDVEQIVRDADNLPWQQTPAVGEGDEYRAESKQGDHASALTFEHTVVHGSVLSAAGG